MLPHPFYQLALGKGEGEGEKGRGGVKLVGHAAGWAITRTHHVRQRQRGFLEIRITTTPAAATRSTCCNLTVHCGVV